MERRIPQSSANAAQRSAFASISPIGLALAPIAAAGLAMSITLMYLAMGSIMQTAGGFVASGGPYEITNPAPAWVGMVPLSIFGMVIFGVIGVALARRDWGANPLIFGWMGLFVALGWNFLRVGLNPPNGLQGAWAWIACGVVFWAMGLAPGALIGGMLIGIIHDARVERLMDAVTMALKGTAYLVAQAIGVAGGIVGGAALFHAVTGV